MGEGSAKMAQRMMAKSNRLSWVVCFVAGSLLGPGAFGETVECDGGGVAGSGAGKISSVPYTITAPGVYCLTQKISTNLATGAAITVSANNVVLDLNDFAIGNLAAGATTQAFGIFAQDQQNIYVRNGILRGFLGGVALLNGTALTASGHRVEGITTDTSYAAGIWVQGPYATIRGNRVMNTRGDPVLYLESVGVLLSSGASTTAGGNGLVQDNLVLETDCANACAAGSPAYGIWVLGSPGTVIQGNRILNSTAPTATVSYAIRLGMSNGGLVSTGVFVLNNMMSNWQNGVFFNTTQGASGDYRFNGALGITGAAYTGGTNITNGGINY
jgi:hypothetical protein